MIYMKKLQREIAYEKIRDSITYGDLKGGITLTEKDICNKFGIGRTPIREAFRQLQMEGYIEVLPNKGAIVRQVSVKEIEDIYDVLSLMEGYAVELAVAKMTSSERIKLKKIKNKLGLYAKNSDSEKWLEENDVFHHYFVELAGNRVLEEDIKKYRRRIYRFRSLSLSIRGSINKLIDEHKFIVNQVIQKNPADASLAMRNHIGSAKDLLVKFLQKNIWI